MMNSTGPQSDPASEPVTLPPVPYTTEELWDDGYPTDAALDLINSFTGTHAELFALVRMLWSPYGVMHVTLTEDGTEKIERLLEQASGRQDVEAISRLGEEYELTRSELEQKMDRWGL